MKSKSWNLFSRLWPVGGDYWLQKIKCIKIYWKMTPLLTSFIISVKTVLVSLWNLIATFKSSSVQHDTHFAKRAPIEKKK